MIGMHACLNTGKTDVLHPINRLSKKRHMITSRDSEKVVKFCQMLIKTSRKLGICVV